MRAGRNRRAVLSQGMRAGRNKRARNEGRKKQESCVESRNRGNRRAVLSQGTGETGELC